MSIFKQIFKKIKEQRNTTSEQCLALTSKEFQKFCSAIVEGHRNHPETFGNLVMSEDLDTRLKVAKTKHMFPKTLDILSCDESVEVRVEIAKNPNTSNTTRERLIKHKV